MKSPPPSSQTTFFILHLSLHHLAVTFFLIYMTAGYIYAESWSLEELLKKTGTTMRWDSLRHMGLLSRGKQTVIFHSGQSWMILNGKQLLSTGTIIEEQGKLIFSSDAAATLFRIFGTEETLPQYRLGTILIDPGHGGRDSGALRYWDIDGISMPLPEKDIVLEISLKLANKLKKLYPRKNIMLTRTDDTYPKLEERVALANSVELGPRECMIYISIHANASLNPKAEGYEIWYLPRNYRRTLVDEKTLGQKYNTSSAITPIVNALWEEEFTHESLRLANMILKGFQEQLGPKVPDRGLKEESWYVVRNAKMASVLLEVGFITNADESARLRQPEYLNRITEGIYNGVREFVSYFEIRENRDTF